MNIEDTIVDMGAYNCYFKIFLGVVDCNLQSTTPKNILK
jgi:hypothetical protein